MDVAAEKFETGLEILKRIPAATLIFLLTVSTGVFAAIVFEQAPGSVIAAAYLLITVVLLAKQRIFAMPRDTLVLAGVTALNCLSILVEPGFVNLTFGVFLLAALALLMSGADGREPLSVVWGSLKSYLFAPFSLAWEMAMTWPARLPTVAGFSVAAAVLPVISLVIFAALFAAANPVIENFFNIILRFDFSQLPWPSVWQSFCFLVASVLCWRVLTLQHKMQAAQVVSMDLPKWHQLYFGVPSVVTTLGALNGLFLVETMLDASYVWSGASLPAGYTYAEYVHRGSYTLIVTALLAAALMVTALRSGSAAAASPVVRGLAYFFCAQNVLLVLSSVKRTLAYVDAYALTEWRLAGLLWMGLVAFGLTCVFWRMWAEKDAGWLKRVNVYAAGAVLLAYGAIDTPAVIARFNVDRAERSAGSLDLDYLLSLGPTVLPALDQYHARRGLKMSQEMSCQSSVYASAVCFEPRSNAQFIQSHWQSWTLRYAMLGLDQ